MIEYKYGDKVSHPEYGVCVFGKILDANNEYTWIWDGRATIHLVSVSDLTPADPSIIKINNVYHRVYTPLDVEEARELVGKGVLYGDRVGTLNDGEARQLISIKDGKVYPYLVRDSHWALIAVPIETPESSEPSKPERTPQQVIDEFVAYIRKYTDIKLEVKQ